MALADVTLALRIAQGILVTDGAVLICYGIISLLFVPSPVGEPYLTISRVLYGVGPPVLGLVSASCAVWLSLRLTCPGPPHIEAYEESVS